MTVFELPTDVASYLRNVRVKNVGTKDAVLRYNSIPYIVRAGDESTVPFEAMCLWLGDPRANDVPQTTSADQGGDVKYIPTRDDEITRLRQLYGMHSMGGSLELVEGVDAETGRTIEYPRMEVTLSSGERLYTVLEDPTGAQANGNLPTPIVARHDKATNDVIDRLEREIAMLKEQKVREEAGFVPGHAPYEPLSESDLPRDEAPDPTAAPLPRGKADNIDFESAVPGDPDADEPDDCLLYTSPSPRD